MNEMDVICRVIRTRRSIRKFKGERVSTGIIWKLLTSGCWAPSAHNSQPWRFVIIQRTEVKRKLAEAMGERFKRDMKRDNCSRNIIENRLAKSLARIREAPVLVLVCLSKEGLRVYPDRRRNHFEENMALQGIGACIQNILLYAHCSGLGACWLSAPMFCQREVVNALGISKKGWKPVALLPFGYAYENSHPSSRFEVKSRSVWL